jgi:hypothetical protein
MRPSLPDQFSPGETDGEIVDLIGKRALYILIERGERGTARVVRYYIRVHGADAPGRRWNTDFKTLREALDFANGRDQSDFAGFTRPAKTFEYPPEVGPVTHISGMTTVDGRAMPTFTVRLRTMLTGNGRKE